jgi:hypothetical protein
MFQASWSLINDPKPNYYTSTTYRYLLNFLGEMQIKVSENHGYNWVPGKAREH